MKAYKTREYKLDTLDNVFQCPQGGVVDTDTKVRGWYLY
jgi:hypothetical protein